MSKKKPRKPRRPADRLIESLPTNWQQFTSPDGHLYYHNTATKESTWSYPSMENKEAPISSPRQAHQDVVDHEAPLLGSPQVQNEQQTRVKMTDEHKRARAGAATSRDVTFLKLQQSLGGKLTELYAGSPPMLHIRRMGTLEGTGDSFGQEMQTPLTVVDDQYKAETVGMSAAERLRFLRKKRQDSKRESICGDDFMAEVAHNMKNKGVVVGRVEGRENDAKVARWEEQEKAEEERKRRQMQDEMDVKRREEERKERERKQVREREERREHERMEQQLALEDREQERRQRQEEESRKKKEKTNDERCKRDAGYAFDCHETMSAGQDVHNRLSLVGRIREQGDEDSNVSSPERVNHSGHSRSQGSKHSISMTRQPIKHMESVEDDHPPADHSLSPRSEVNANAVRDEKQHIRGERRARKQRGKDMLAALKLSPVTPELLPPKSTSSSNERTEAVQTRSSSIIKVDKDARVKEKQLRRERRRMAKLEATLAAQTLDGGTSGQETAQPVHSSEPHTDSSDGPRIGSAHGGGHPLSGQPLPGQPSGGMYSSCPYMTMPPPPSLYGNYYPFVQPYPMPLPMYPPGIVLPGYQSMAPPPPHSANGMAMPSALIPYGADSTLKYDMNFGGMPSSPELSKCDCCKGIGVGLVEKNGICAHCNRLRLAFIVDSAQMRLRCLVCGGWGFRLLQANRMCEHCTRKIAQQSQRSLSVAAAAARRPWQTSAKTKSEKYRLDDIDWDKSWSDDSDWDD